MKRDGAGVKSLWCRLRGHRWNYCCKYAYAAGHLWCRRCLTTPAHSAEPAPVSGNASPSTGDPS